MRNTQRDAGFDFAFLDKYSQNVLAQGFEAASDESFDLVTCIEVVEHLVDPLPTFQELGALAPSIFISTELLPFAGNRPGEWWYYSPETGQHVSFYTVPSLEVIAERLNRRLATDGVNLHVLSSKKVSDGMLRLLSSRAGRSLARAFIRLNRHKRKSLIAADAEKLRSLRSR